MDSQNENSGAEEEGPSEEGQSSPDTDGETADALMRVYSEGGTDIEVCKALRMSKKSFDKREKDDASFAQLVEHGRLEKAWWLEVGRKAAKNGAPANASTFWSMWMKNRYG